MVNSSALLWLQFAYFLWQFIRVAKYCRIPYALVVHTFMWLTGRWSPPFALRTYLVLGSGRPKFYVDRRGAESVLADCLDRADRFRVIPSRPEKESGLAVIDIPAVNYKLCIRESRINESFVWNYLRDRPECFGREAELLLPNLVLLDRVSDLEGLKRTCQGDFIPGKRKERFLAVPDRERELNQNFMRLLSALPLMAQALGHEELSLWISGGILVVDQLSLFFNWSWQMFSSSFFYLFTVSMIDTYFRPQTREMLSTLSSIVSERMTYSDQVRKSLIRVREGDVIYTMSPFNLADFEEIIDRPLKRERKTPSSYSEEKFGKFTYAGEEVTIEEGSSVLTHYVDGARIDSIFKDDGGFYNFRNNEHLHFGMWEKVKRDMLDMEDAQGTEDDFSNFQDLLQIMEEMQMLPFVQTHKDQFQSLHFNMFLSPGRSFKDLTFLVAKKTIIIGG